MSRIYFKLKDLDILSKSSINQTLNRLSKTYKIFKNNKWMLSISTKKNLAFLNELNIPIA
jgi:hypothetical protein